MLQPKRVLIIDGVDVTQRRDDTSRIAQRGGGNRPVSVNFNFRSISKDLPAGQYSVTALRSGSTLVLKLTNEKSRHGMLLVSQYEIHGDRDEQPRLVFRCNSSECGLSEIWMGGTEGYKVPKPKLTPPEGERIAIVPLWVIHSNGD